MAYTAAPEGWWQDFVGGETARTAKLTKSCRYAKTIRVGRGKVGRSRSLRVRIRFGGNTALRAASKTYTVRMRR